jgi:hypothetical protein
VVAGDTPVLVHNCGNEDVHAPENITSNLDDNVYFHYTNADGYSSILNDDGSLTIAANPAGKVHVTQEMSNPSEVETNIFAGMTTHAGRGEFAFAFRMPEGVDLVPGSQSNELITYGSLRIPADNVLYHGENPFQ